MPEGAIRFDETSPVLCLSGGGFRATLFHLGAVRRLNELGLLSRLGALASVSGGSILNGLLAKSWSLLQRDGLGRFGNFDEVIAVPLRAFCQKDLRTPLLLGYRLNPLRWPRLLLDHGTISGNALSQSYRAIFADIELGSLPPPQSGRTPRFVICATCVHTGACWHFHGGPNGRMGDFYTGYTDARKTTIAEAVAASSAFPPAFAGFRLPTSGRVFTRIDPWGESREQSKKRVPWDPVKAGEVTLTDGGVYDNLGVETVWDRTAVMLVSDAGRPFLTLSHPGQSLVSRLGRAASISMEQVGAIRKRWLIERFEASRHSGAYWGIDTPICDYGMTDGVRYGPTCRALLSSIRTDFNSFSEGETACLENHGYALADAALRSRVASLCPATASPASWPHAAWGHDEVAIHSLASSSSRTLLRDVFRFLNPSDSSHT